MRTRRILNAAAMVLLVGVGALVALLAALRVEHTRPVTLPVPSGLFAIGRALYDWRDDGGVDALAPSPGTKRELLVWIWYPAATPRSAVTQDYLPATLLPAIQRSRANLIGALLTRDLSKVRGHAVAFADLSPGQQSYPVVLMRGGASAEVWSYSTLAEDLASHGYVVVGFDAPWRSGIVAFPDGRVMARLPQNNPELVVGAPDSASRINKILVAWTGDMAFALDRLQQLNTGDPSGKFAGRLDLRRVGVFGHSLGGAEAAQFCHDDTRCRAGIDIDGAPLGSVIRDGIRKPFMFLLGDHGGPSDPQSREIMATIHSIYDRLPVDGRLLLEIRGANHFLFSDDGALLKSHIALGALRLLGVVGMEGRRQLEVTTYCVRGFFDRYVKGAVASPPPLPSPRYPEIQHLQ